MATPAATTSSSLFRANKWVFIRAPARVEGATRPRTSQTESCPTHPCVKGSRVSPSSGAARPRRSRVEGSVLLPRILGFDALRSKCDARMRPLATVLSPATGKKIVAHLGVRTEPLPRAREGRSASSGRRLGGGLDPPGGGAVACRPRRAPRAGGGRGGATLSYPLFARGPPSPSLRGRHSPATVAHGRHSGESQ
jgi:hypothetical protein